MAEGIAAGVAREAKDLLAEKRREAFEDLRTVSEEIEEQIDAGATLGIWFVQVNRGGRWEVDWDGEPFYEEGAALYRCARFIEAKLDPMYHYATAEQLDAAGKSYRVVKVSLPFEVVES